MTQLTARQEWRRYPILPIAAALGYATSVIHIYSLGPLIGPLTSEFGWSRTQATMGLTIATVIQAIFGVGIGLAVDRVGPRLFALIGIPAMLVAFALLGFTTASPTSWYLLWSVLAIATLPCQATIWTSAVATRFETSRGLAFAVTLCGASVAIVVFPVLATWLIQTFGWRRAVPIEAAIWIVIAFPVIAIHFRGAHDKQRKADPGHRVDRAELPGVSLKDGLTSSIYARLMVASLLFTFCILALVVHFVPILTDAGASPLGAARIASLVGLASMFGRLSTGFLLDRFRGSLVGAMVFSLPIGACLLLLLAGHDGTAQSAAAILIGLTLGAEIDVVVYLNSRHFGLRNFGGLYGGLLVALSIGTASGPLAAAKVFDLHGSYAPFLWVTIGLMVLSSVALMTLPRPAFAHGGIGEG